MQSKFHQHQIYINVSGKNNNINITMSQDKVWEFTNKYMKNTYSETENRNAQKNST